VSRVRTLLPVVDVRATVLERLRKGAVDRRTTGRDYSEDVFERKAVIGRIRERGPAPA
jgi:hypothetical protein